MTIPTPAARPLHKVLAVDVADSVNRFHHTILNEVITTYRKTILSWLEWLGTLLSKGRMHCSLQGGMNTPIWNMALIFLFGRNDCPSRCALVGQRFPKPLLKAFSLVVLMSEGTNRKGSISTVVGE